jgi:hypothetical protein
MEGPISGSATGSTRFDRFIIQLINLFEIIVIYYFTLLQVSRQLTNEKTGKKGCPVVLASITTRFRRELRLFQTFSVRTKLLCWVPMPTIC